MDAIIKYVVGEMRVIAGAPTIFVIALLVLAAAVWWAMDWKYAGVISNKDSEIALAKSQRDDYKDKLSGATPDQAKARIDALEARLASVEPRRLTPSQRAALIARLSPPTGGPPGIAIVSESSGDSPQFAADFASVFRSAGGWNITEASVMGLGNRPPSGIALNAPNTTAPEVVVIANALRAANISFDLRQQSMMPNISIELLICTKITG
jgi:hypothetical protein